MTLPSREQVLSVEPTLRAKHGNGGLRKLKAPYAKLTAMHQLVILTFFLTLDIPAPANDIWGDEHGWFY